MQNDDIRLPLESLAKSLAMDPKHLHLRCLTKYKALKALGDMPHKKGVPYKDRLFDLNEAQALYLAEGSHSKRIRHAFAKARRTKQQWLKAEPCGDGLWDIIGMVPESMAMDLLKKMYP